MALVSSKARNLVFGIGIFIVFMFVLGAGFQAFYPGPDYADFCGEAFAKPRLQAENCTIPAAVTQAENECYEQNGIPKYTYENNCPTAVTCDFCQQEFDAAHSSYTNVVFIVSLIIGVLTVLVGLLVLSIEPVGSALLASGIGAVIFGVISNWRNFTAAWRFLLLFAVLVVLILFAIRFNKKK